MFRIGEVVAVDGATRRAELVMLETGERIAGARIIGATASDSGSWSVPSVSRPRSENDAGRPGTPGRKLHAVVGMLHGHAVVFGFIQPAKAWSVSTPDHDVHMHPSGTAVAIEPDGAVQVRHASGTSFRIGAGAALPPGQGGPAGGGAAAPVTLTTGGLSLAFDPASGDVTLTCTTLKVNGKIEATGDVKAGTISLQQHKHGGVQTGAGQTGVAVA